MNREMRRQAGIYEPIEPDPKPFNLLRYIRRHYSEDVMLRPATRRQRKARARIMRSVTTIQ